MITRLPVAADTGQVTLMLAPNRALSRKQMWQSTWGLCIAAMVVAGLAAFAGDILAPLFALIEVPVLAVALWLVWRSGDRKERITLDIDHLQIDQVPSRGCAASTFPIAWTRVRVQDRADGHRHVVLSAHGREQEVGRCLGDAERMELSQSLASLLSGRSGWREN
ncbi:MAG: DUF2244 domain-containing protein [Rhodanobacteraceae bacterium]